MEFELNVLLRCAVALGLCGLLGWERETAGKSAGIRTHMMIGMASALFVALAGMLVRHPDGTHPGIQHDPIRVLEAVVTGVSFLGAGMIFSSGREGVKGLTTAAGILVTASVGMMAGLEYYLLATGVTLMTFIVMYVLGLIRDRASGGNTGPKESAPPAESGASPAAPG